MSKILSIDLDYILKPCIQLFNDRITNFNSYQILWGNIFDKLDCERFMSIDKENYSFLKYILSRIDKDSTKCPVYMSFDHANILTMLEELFAQGIVKPPFDIVNIDHHHDIAYSREKLLNMIKYGEPDCVNWVAYLKSQNLLGDYLWIFNENSEPYVSDFPIVFRTCLKQEFDFKPEDYDAVFVSSSIDFFPPNIINSCFTLLKVLFDRRETGVICYNANFTRLRNGFTSKDILSCIYSEGFEGVED